MTNGRMLSQPPYTQRLLQAGMNRFYVSIHGHEEKLHEGLTRTPGSFAQTVRGLDVVRALGRSRGIDVHTSTVITKRNLPYMLEIYRFLRAHGVDQVVFNVMQANGRANTYFEQIFPTYTEIAAAFRSFLTANGEERAMAFLVDIPLCTTEGIPDFNRGYVEAHTHYGSRDEARELLGEVIPAERLTAGGKLVEITRADLDQARRQWRGECDGCRYRAVCEGVWGNYLARNGWDEFVPVPA
jgi:MoaA/NifB/PqqE/SkfB family radical SAM enzyme